MDLVRSIPARQLALILQCGVCHGFAIDAVSLPECDHIFCKSCIVPLCYTTPSTCPVPGCAKEIHKTRPLGCIKNDTVLQTLLTKLFPNVYLDEMRRRREFFEHYICQRGATIEKLSGESIGIPLSKSWLRKIPALISVTLLLDTELSLDEMCVRPKPSCSKQRNIFVPSNATVAVIKKFLEQLHGLSTTFSVVLLHGGMPVPDNYELGFFVQFGISETANIKLRYCLAKLPIEWDDLARETWVRKIANRRVMNPLRESSPVSSLSLDDFLTTTPEPKIATQFQDREIATDTTTAQKRKSDEIIEHDSPESPVKKVAAGQTVEQQKMLGALCLSTDAGDPVNDVGGNVPMLSVAVSSSSNEKPAPMTENAVLQRSPPLFPRLPVADGVRRGKVPTGIVTPFTKDSQPLNDDEQAQSREAILMKLSKRDPSPFYSSAKSEEKRTACVEKNGLPESPSLPKATVVPLPQRPISFIKDRNGIGKLKIGAVKPPAAAVDAVAASPPSCEPVAKSPTRMTAPHVDGLPADTAELAIDLGVEVCVVTSTVSPELPSEDTPVVVRNSKPKERQRFIVKGLEYSRVMREHSYSRIQSQRIALIDLTDD